MRRTKMMFSALLSGMILLSALSVFSAAETIKLNGEVVGIPAEMGSIQERDDRTFVPVRFIMENLGCTVEYIDETQTALISSGAATYLIQEGNPILFVLPGQYSETETIQMDTSAFIETALVDGQEYGRMYIPIRFLAEAIGYDVGWDEVTQTVTLSNKK